MPITRVSLFAKMSQVVRASFDRRVFQRCSFPLGRLSLNLLCVEENQALHEGRVCAENAVDFPQ